MRLARINLMKREIAERRRTGQPVEEAVRKLAKGMRGKIRELENAARYSEDGKERMAALLSLIGKARELRLGLERKKIELGLMRKRDGPGDGLAVLIEEMETSYDACHFALERLTWADDKEIRDRAFGFVKFNEGALRVTCSISPHDDIRGRTRRAIRQGIWLKPRKKAARSGNEQVQAEGKEEKRPAAGPEQGT